MLEVIFIKKGEFGGEQYISFPANWLVERPGKVKINATCPIYVLAGPYSIAIRYCYENGNETRFKSTNWNYNTQITAGEEFSLELDFPEEMFTIVGSPVKKSWIKTVYKYIINFRRNKK